MKSNLNAYDDVFLIIVIAGFLVLMPIGVYHRVKSNTGEKLDRRQEGLFVLVTLRAHGIAGLFGLIAYMIDPSWTAWSSVPLPNWLRWIPYLLAEEHDAAVNCVEAEPLHTLFPGDL
ncbi:MAG: hypothetical protein ACREOO_10650 [bacterium]